MQGWIGVDLDGTLAEYDEWRGIDHIGTPIEPMAARVRRWIAQGELELAEKASGGTWRARNEGHILAS